MGSEPTLGARSLLTLGMGGTLLGRPGEQVPSPFTRRVGTRRISQRSAGLGASPRASGRTAPGIRDGLPLPAGREAVLASAAMTTTTQTDGGAGLPRGRTPPLDPVEADHIFRHAVALFNGARYWHAHEAWETLWRAAEDPERLFYQGLIQVAAGLLHLQRRNLRGARMKLDEGAAKLRAFEPVHHGIFVNELIGRADRLLEELRVGQAPYLIPPVIRFVDADRPDWSR